MTTIGASSLSEFQWQNDWQTASENDDLYGNDDHHEETTSCYAFFTRKGDAVLSVGTSNGQPSRTSSFPRLCSTAQNEKDSVMSGCVSPSSLSRPSSLSTLDEYTEEELNMLDGDDPTEVSDLRPTPETQRTFWVVTTAALPWMTGTAVNPLLRAAYLSRLNREYTNKSTVTLMVPWLESPEERETLYGCEWKDATPATQEAFIRSWLAEKAKLPLEAKVEQGGIKIMFYPARYHSKWGSIFPIGDICHWIPKNATTDVCFLEEPEHLNIVRSSGNLSWTDRFRFVVGIVHTNYRAYASSHYSGILSTPVVTLGCSLVVRAACHKIIKLSPVLQSFAPEKEVISNVHGVRKEFLEEGRRRALEGGNSGVYFVGKLLWAKGFDKMLTLQLAYRKTFGEYFPLHVYGTGPDEEEIKRYFRGREKLLSASSSDDLSNIGSLQEKGSKVDLTEVLPYWWRQPMPVSFLGRKDHAALTHDYKIFVNPSESEVLCTTTAEALAMGKFVLVPSHPSNVFFRQFPNCLQYESKSEFVALLQHALSHEPEPMSEEFLSCLSWEAATERCLVASNISKRDERRRERAGEARRDERAAKIHYELNKGLKGAVIRKMMRADPLIDKEIFNDGWGSTRKLVTQ